MPRPGDPDPARRGATLARALSALRRRTLLVGLGRALLLAVAADMVYDLVGIGLFHLTGKSIYYPPFFAVILAVLALRAAASAAMPVLARRLDAGYRLKDRLTSHLAFRGDPAIPGDLVEAQAAETLASVDLAAIRRATRVRPLVPLAAIAVCSVALWFLLWRYPYAPPPQNFVFRHGARVASIVRGLLPAGHPPVPGMTTAGKGAGPGTRPAAEPARPEDLENARKAPPIPEGAEKPPAEQAGTGPSGTPTPAPVAREERAPADQKPAAESPESAVATKGPAGERMPPGNRYGGSFNAQSRMRIVSRETTRRAAGLADAPPRPLIPPPGISGTAGGRTFILPSLPRLSLADRLPGRDVLLDPDTVYVSPEGTSGRYRDLVAAYYRELLALKGEEHGSY